MKHFLWILLLTLPFFSFSQILETDLNGFRLNQYREVPINQLKTITASDKFDDGYEYELFLLEPDSSVYMIFMYPNYDTQLIWSLQITGSKAGFDCGFKGLKLGMSKKEVKKILGKPTNKVDAGQYGSRWEYENTNYSVEINTDGLLSSIKLIDRTYDFYEDFDIEKLPKFNDFSKVLASKDRRKISEILCPSMEIYKDSSTYFFNYAWENEILTDASNIYHLLEDLSDILADVDIENPKEYEENMRVTQGRGYHHVVKIFKDGKHYELVFKYHFGKYLLWEVFL